MNTHPLSLACLAALALTACSKETATACDEPLYGGKATDEAWHSMVDASSKPTDSSRAVTVTSPTPGQVYAATDPAPAWAWTLPQATLRRPGALTPRHTAPTPRSSLARLGEWILPSAEAHLAPFTGELFWVQVFTPGATCPVAQMLTSDQSWQLDEDSWAALGTHAGETLSVQVTRAYLVENDITEGPYKLDPPPTIRRSAP
jgi:hypothetical protein